jgi:protein ImuB
MPARRILSLWFPRLGAERLLRGRRGLPEPAFAVVGTVANRQGLVALNAGAEAAGLYRGQPLADARAICPALVTAPQDHHGEAQFLATLRRWAGRFSPWVAEEPPEGLVIDLSGAAHLFGGEEGVLAAVAGDCARLGLSVAAAAWPGRAPGAEPEGWPATAMPSIRRPAPPAPVRRGGRAGAGGRCRSRLRSGPIPSPPPRPRQA